MSRTRPSRAAARTLRLLLLASLVMLGPLAATPSHAWTPPPAPLPIEPGDTDGMDDDDYDLSRPGPDMSASADIRLSAPGSEPSGLSTSRSGANRLGTLLQRLLRVLVSRA